MHKNLSGPKSRKAKNHFYCGSLCQRLVLSFRKRNFLIRQLFLVKTDRQRLKTSRPKKTICPLLPTIFDEIPNKYDRKCSTFWKNLIPFFLLKLQQFFSTLSAEFEQFCQNFIPVNSHYRFLAIVQERIAKKRKQCISTIIFNKISAKILSCCFFNFQQNFNSFFRTLCQFTFVVTSKIVQMVGPQTWIQRFFLVTRTIFCHSMSEQFRKQNTSVVVHLRKHSHFVHLISGSTDFTSHTWMSCLNMFPIRFHFIQLKNKKEIS